MQQQSRKKRLGFFSTTTHPPKRAEIAIRVSYTYSLWGIASDSGGGFVVEYSWLGLEWQSR